MLQLVDLSLEDSGFEMSEEGDYESNTMLVRIEATSIMIAMHH